jgi:Uncharacterized proteins of the AP superfamily
MNDFPHHPKGPWLGDILPSAIAACGQNLRAAPDFGIAKSTSCIVVVVDGLGWNVLNDWKAHCPTLRSFLPEATVLPTCLPSTTAAALTSLTTGELPGATRMMGYSVAQGDGVMTMLKFEGCDDPAGWQPVPTFFEQLRDEVRPVVVTAPRFASSGLTLASMRGATFMGANSLASRFENAIRAVKEPSLVYLYWSEIDHAGHQNGVGSDRWIAELEEFDAELGAFLRRVPRDTSVVLTADHGMVNVEERIDLAAEPGLSEGVRLIAGEGRCVHVHTNLGYEETISARWQDILGSKAVMIEKARFADVFGEGPGVDLLGSAVAMLTGSSVIVDSRTQTAASIAQVGVHGSFSDVEVEIPLLILA